MMQKLTAKLILLFLMTSLIPLAIFATLAISKARATASQTVIAGNKNMADQVAGRINQYMANAILILESLTENINRADLEDWQRQKILRNYAVTFDTYNYLRILSPDGSVKVTSEAAMPTQKFMGEDLMTALQGKKSMSSVFMTDDYIPAMTVMIPIKTRDMVDAILMAEIDLLDLWKLVESVKIGKTGHLNILTRDGKIFASGDGNTKIQAIKMASYPDWGNLLEHHQDAFERKVGGKNILVVSSSLPEPFSWTVTVEEEAAEAYALPRAMSRQIQNIILLLIAAVILLGTVMTKRGFLQPVNKLMKRIQDIAHGNLHGSVNISGESEFAQLAQTLNTMSGELIHFQQELVRKEKQALLGRIASSIAHDLKHPVTSIENYARLLQVKHSDEEFRNKFQQTVNREFARVHTFLGNLSDLSKEIPFTPILTTIDKVIDGVAMSLAPEFDKNKIIYTKESSNDFHSYIDMFSFQRVLNNLMRNAMEAMPMGGNLKIRTEIVENNDGGKTAKYGRITISDSGVGIAPERLPQLFDDLKTTKKTGLGLGLAITKKIIAQHNGEISVRSEAGVGTTFEIKLPVSDAIEVAA